jgi:orotidine-5'-phosphate decarboxylase
MENATGIVFAADIVDKRKLLKTVEEVSPYVEAIKIGNVGLLEYGWPIIQMIKQCTERPVIADLKFMDIPDMAKIASEKIVQYGGDGIMVCGPVGGDAIAVCKTVLSDKIVIVFTQFTHTTGLITDEMANEYIDLALALKCTAVQVPGTLPNRVRAARERVRDQMLIISCGVGAQGPVIGSAVAEGADYEIIGRYIYDPKSPFEKSAAAAKSAQAQINEIASKHGSRARSE